MATRGETNGRPRGRSVAAYGEDAMAALVRQFLPKGTDLLLASGDLVPHDRVGQSPGDYPQVLCHLVDGLGPFPVRRVRHRYGSPSRISGASLSLASLLLIAMPRKGEILTVLSPVSWHIGTKSIPEDVDKVLDQGGARDVGACEPPVAETLTSAIDDVGAGLDTLGRCIRGSGRDQTPDLLDGREAERRKLLAGLPREHSARAEQEPPACRIALKHGEVPFGASAQLFAWRGIGIDLLKQVGLVGGSRPFDASQIGSFFALEVVVDDRARHAGGPSDVLHRHSGISAGQEQLLSDA
jgi:hypothetical protein